ncbi:MAG: polysulfide reductase NrfD [Bacteroidales bacterium]|nr:polysulfide reductase NrfD [Bacteroidales bacterium]
MSEEIFVSGRNIPNIDPVLHIWHWQIPVYLFLGGLAAGLMFFSAFNYLRGRENKHEVTVKWASFIVPIALVLGLIALFLDLKHQLYFWRLYTTIRFDSPMSWGAWTLMAITPLSFLWCFSYLREFVSAFSGKKKWIDKALNFTMNIVFKFKWVATFEAYVIKNRKAMAWANVILSFILGIYTGILLSAFNARPLWNSSILGPLFLVSGLSTAAALIMWLTKDKDERKLFGQIDLLLIGLELFLITHMFMGFLAGSQVKIEAAQLFLGGEFTAAFWTFVVGIGLVIPAIFEIMKLRGYKIPVALPAMLILIGGLIFRFIMVDAGQITRFLY